MKKILLFVFAFVVLASCRKQREVYLEAELTSGSDVYYYSLSGNSEGRERWVFSQISMGQGWSTSYQPDTNSILPLGSVCTTNTVSTRKGLGMYINAQAYCLSSGPPYNSNYIPGPYELTIRVYVDGELGKTEVFNQDNTQRIVKVP